MKLSLCMLVKNEELLIDLPLNSVLGLVDEVVMVHDGEVKDDTEKIVRDICSKNNIPLKFIVDTKHNGHFGRQRQIILDNAEGEWVLWLDADECIDEKLKESIKNRINVPDIFTDSFHIEYQHFINDFLHVDNTLEIHIGLFRLYKNNGKVNLSTIKNHALPNGKEFKQTFLLPSGYIWHLGYLKGVVKAFQSYLLNLNQSEIHNPYQICKWRDRHLLGFYPTREININAIPKIIINKFHINIYDSNFLLDFIGIK